MAGADTAGTLTLPEGVSEIADHAFRGCSMREVVIPASCNEIGTGAFEDCGALETAHFAAPAGWRYGGSLPDHDMSDPAEAAQRLTQMSAMRWIRVSP